MALKWIDEKYADCIKEFCEKWPLMRVNAKSNERDRLVALMPKAFWTWFDVQDTFAQVYVFRNLQHKHLCLRCKERTPFSFKAQFAQFSEACSFCLSCRNNFSREVKEIRISRKVTQRDFIAWKKQNVSGYKKKFEANQKLRQKKMEATCLKKYGAKNHQSTEIGRKLREAGCKRKYGVTNCMLHKEVRAKHRKSMKELDFETRQEKIKATCQEKWGADHYLMSEAGKRQFQKTMIRKHGVHNMMLTPEVKEIHAKAMAAIDPKLLANVGEKNGMRTIKGRAAYDASRLRRDENAINSKRIATIKEKYDVPHHMHLPWMREKVLKACFQIKESKIEGKLYRYQGWELPALTSAIRKYGKANVIGQFDKRAIVINLPQDRSYSPDFFIKTTNTLVEVKSSYTIFTADRLAMKARACEKEGYKFMLLVSLGGDFDSRLIKVPDWWKDRPKSELAKWLLAQGVNDVSKKILGLELSSPKKVQDPKQK